MPVLDELWGQDLGMRESSLRVCPDESPGSPVWGPLRMPPVTCGGLTLALELPALLRQLRAAWRARRGGTCPQDESPGSTWVESQNKDADQPKQERESSCAHVEGTGNCRIDVGPVGMFLAKRRASYPLSDLRILKTGAQAGQLESGTRRKVKRLLSFQSYCRTSRLPRGLVPHVPGSLHFLDDDYRGQAANMLSKINSWSFDIFLLEHLTNGNALVTLMCHLFQIYDLVQHFQLDVVKLHRFLGMLQEDYHSQNSYHNAVHAADVTQAIYCFLQDPKLARHLTPLDVFLGLVAAAAHDVDHPGVTQPFLIKTRHHLASLYQNTSVLESHHWRSTVGTLRDSGLLTHLPVETTRVIEQRLGSLILATDIVRQNEFLLTFREHLDVEDLDLEMDSHRHFTLQIALKCADVCNPCRVWALSRQWSERVCEEFYRQGDLERKLDLEVSPQCDQQLDSIPAIQIGFISSIVEPLFLEWSRFTEPSALSRTMLNHLRKNRSRWRRLLSTHTLSWGESCDNEDGSSEDVP